MWTGSRWILQVGACKPEATIELGCEGKLGAEGSCEEFGIEVRWAVGFAAKNFEEDIFVIGLAFEAEPLRFVLVGVRVKTRGAG